MRPGGRISVVNFERSSFLRIRAAGRRLSCVCRVVWGYGESNASINWACGALHAEHGFEGLS